ncbi:hypothetical protein BS47DRAFT_1401681 [Hydnum rufescens UP504]|uniref:Uncharacterized protein n=1 Tax=Hydnum rufescens UP504 TaxID=1448309 RepID=A0A9P6DHY5_9AGAM|nr:hypothetical protein BS47DRAFT_1401681 [Hydnum rufescens UP504]
MPAKRKATDTKCSPTSSSRCLPNTSHVLRPPAEDAVVPSGALHHPREGQELGSGGGTPSMVQDPPAEDAVMHSGASRHPREDPELVGSTLPTLLLTWELSEASVELEPRSPDALSQRYALLYAARHVGEVQTRTNDRDVDTYVGTLWPPSWWDQMSNHAQQGSDDRVNITPARPIDPTAISSSNEYQSVEFGALCGDISLSRPSLCLIEKLRDGIVAYCVDDKSHLVACLSAWKVTLGGFLCALMTLQQTDFWKPWSETVYLVTGTDVFEDSLANIQTKTLVVHKERKHDFFFGYTRDLLTIQGDENNYEETGLFSKAYGSGRTNKSPLRY